MTERKQLKASARAILRETRPSAIWVTLMVAGILLIMEALSLSINGDLEAYRAMYNSLLEGRLEYVAAAGTNSPIGWLLGMALDLMGMVLAVGYTLYILRLSRRQGPSFGDVFDAFGLFLRAVWITILRRVLVSLWGVAYVVPATVLGTVMDPFVAALVCLPLLIPMIMASYSYRLAVFIALDERQYTCGQCMMLSRMAMQGRKWELFRLDLSFLGWQLLSIIPVVFLWVEPYMSVTVAEWYDGIMPGFREKLEKDLAQRRNESFYRRSARGNYHVPGEPWHGDDDSSDASDEDEPRD